MAKVLLWLLSALGMALLSGPTSACSMMPLGNSRLAPDALVFAGSIQRAVEVASMAMLEVRVTRPVRGVEQGDVVRLLPLGTDTDCSPIPLTAADLKAYWSNGMVVLVVGRPLTLPLGDGVLVVEAWEGSGGSISRLSRAPAVEPAGVFTDFQAIKVFLGLYPSKTALLWDDRLGTRSSCSVIEFITGECNPPRDKKGVVSIESFRD